MKAKGKKKTFIEQYRGLLGLVLVLGAVLFLLLVTQTKSPSRRGRSERAAKKTEEVEGRKKSRAKREKASTTEKRLERERMREERRKAREEKRLQRLAERLERRKGTTRTERAKGGSRGTASISQPYVLRMILQEGNEWYAVVGERRLKKGEDVMGRKVIEIGSGSIEVEYRGMKYPVRVGEPVIK